MTAKQRDELICLTLTKMRYEDDSGTRSELYVLGRCLIEEYRVMNFDEMKKRIEVGSTSPTVK